MQLVNQRRIGLIDRNIAMAHLVEGVCQQLGLQFYHIDTEQFNFEMIQDLSFALVIKGEGQILGEDWIQGLDSKSVPMIEIGGANEGDIGTPVSPKNLRDCIQKVLG